MRFFYPKKDNNEYYEASENVELFESADEIDYVPSIIEYACEAMKLIVMNRFRERELKKEVREFFESIDKYEEIVFRIRTLSSNDEINSEKVNIDLLSNQSKDLTKRFLTLMVE